MLRKILGKAALPVAVAAALVLSACGVGTAEVRTDTLVVGAPSMPTNFDPVLANNVPSARLMEQIFDTLIHIDHNMQPQPRLALSWEWVDPAYPTQLRLLLRQGVLFHNGDELTARDVQFSLDRAASSPIVANVAGVIESTTVINDWEVVINLNQPFVPFLNFLGHNAFFIVNERAVTEMGQTAHSQAPVGTGPYRLTNIVAGDRVEFTRWDSFWGSPVSIENVIVRTIPDASTRLIAIETGEIDIMFDVPMSDMNRVMAHPGITLFYEENFSMNYIAFNTSRPPFNDIRVRLAVQHAIDLDAMVRAVYMGAGVPGTGPINSRIWASAQDRLEPFPHNVQLARDLLAEAGLSGGFSASFFTHQGNPQRSDTAEIMQNMLRNIGINLSIHILEWGTFLEAASAGEPDMHMLGWPSGTGDPDEGLFGPFHSSNFGASGNRSFFNNAQVDALLEAGRREADPVLRAEIYYQIQRIIRDESPWIFQSPAMELIGVRNNVQGFRIAPNFRHQLWPLSFASN